MRGSGKKPTPKVRLTKNAYNIDKKPASKAAGEYRS